MHGLSPPGQTRPQKKQVINLSENQTVNVKELTSEISSLKKMVESLVKEPGAKGLRLPGDLNKLLALSIMARQ
jgi:regulator of replication initiation timing